MADRSGSIARQLNISNSAACRGCWSLLAAACVVSSLGCTAPVTAATTWFSSLPAAKQADILWKEDHETAVEGDAGSWDNGAGKPWASGNYEWGVTTTTAQVHSGSKALWSRIDTAAGQSGVRWPMRYLSPTWKPSGLLPNEAYYSGWVKFPAAFSSDWYMLMQWKTAGNEARNNQSDPIKSVNFHRTGNQMFLHLTDFADAEGRYYEDGNTVDNSPIPFPLNEWVHLEAYYKHATDKTGAIVVWQNGVEILRLENTITQYNYTGSGYPRQWAINAYGDGLNPNPHTMYLDDAAISKSRLGASTGSTALPGDFNRDGRVDAADYTVWRDTLGSTTDLRANGANTGASQNKIDQADYDFWKNEFGGSDGGGTVIGGAVATDPVPEPAAVLVSGCMLVALFFRRRCPIGPTNTTPT